MNLLFYALGGFFVLWPAFVLPVIGGIAILLYFRDDPVRGLAGAFTLKPLIATPAWLFLLLLAAPHMGITLLYTLIPGIGLTLVLIYAFRGVIRTEIKTALILLAGDAIRWLYSFAYLLWSPGPFDDPIMENPLFLIGVLLPNAYALMAFLILWLRRSRGWTANRGGFARTGGDQA